MTDYSLLLQQTGAFLQDIVTEESAYANLASLLYHNIEDVSWVGFYFVRQPDTLTLSAFQGKPACTKIPFGKGV